MSNRLQAGIDFSQKKADFCLLFPDGRPLVPHRAFDNSLAGYTLAKALLLDAVQQYGLEGIDVSGEATGCYWLPFFLQLAADPELSAHDLNLFALNPRWVTWFKKSFPPDHKSDERDPFYIADRTRTHRPAAVWSCDEDVLALRFYTRLRFHVMHTVAREKCYFSAFLFLKASAYHRLRPFADVFGVTSGLLLTTQPSLEDLATLPLHTLADQLHELSGHHLREPEDNARKLQAVAQESFPLPQALVMPVQHVLTLTLENIRFLEAQLQQVDGWIAAQLAAHPAGPLAGVRCLDTVPGIGPVLSASILAEIGDVQRFLQGTKWDKKHHRPRARNLRDAEDAVAKMAGLWWPRRSSGDFEAQDRRMSKAGNRYLRYFLIEAANRMRQLVPEYEAFYWRKYREVTQHQHKRALALTARKGVGLLVGLLHRQESYRPGGASLT